MERNHAIMKKTKKAINLAGIVLCILAFGAAVLFGLNINDNLGALSMLCLIFSMMHCIKRYGIKNAVVFFLIVNVIAMFYENLSILTTFPFGNYYYTDGMGRKIFLVPFGINLAYFGMIYICWTIADVLTGHYSIKLCGKMVAIKPFIAGFIMVMWDLLFDPFMSTILKNWIWKEGGAYFGVPFSNFIGWYLCVFTMLFLFALYMRFFVSKSEDKISYTRGNYIQFCAMYIGWFLGFLIKSFVPYPVETVVDACGKTWYTSDIFQACALVGVFTSFFVIVLVVERLFHPETRTSQNPEKV